MLCVLETLSGSGLYFGSAWPLSSMELETFTPYRPNTLHAGVTRKLTGYQKEDSVYFTWVGGLSYLWMMIKAITVDAGIAHLFSS